MPEFQTDAGIVHVHFDGYQPPPLLTDEELRRTSYVIDGDTIKVGGQRWRLYGIDAAAVAGASRGAPHCRDEATIGLRAKAELERLIVEGRKNGTLCFEILHLREKYNRHMVRIAVNGLDVGERLKDMGLAHDYRGHGPKRPFCSCLSAWERYFADRKDSEFRQQEHVKSRAIARQG